MKKLVIAGGCFWGVEAYYSALKGVIETKAGYANGKISDPTYEDVKTGATRFAEAVEIIFDENIISPEKLLEHLFRFIDPTSLNRQGNDIGSQYRTGIYYVDENDKTIAERFIESVKNNYNKPIMVEVASLSNFYVAEDYHQKYLFKNPGGYCHVNLSLIKPEEKK